MLVCNVSLRPPRAAIAADLVEASAAADEAAIGNVVFATLVDDPVSVVDLVDAFLGEIMVEAASADATADAGLIYIASVVEDTTAVAIAIITDDAGMTETASASATEDATVISTGVTWNPADKAAAVTLSNGDLTAQGTSGSGAYGVRATSSRSSGKYYFEVKITGTVGNAGPAMALATVSMATMGSIVGEALINLANGTVFLNSASSAGTTVSYAANDVCCIAVDFTNQKIWFRKNAGNWDNNVAHDPATNAGGFSISFRSTNALYPTAHFSSTTLTILTANFGGTAFAQTPPSGFLPWQ